ncbi:type III pantothenate kinase [Spongiivirga citrea]|uniref:Type III pantothenate kinase n=1 Tax=Spongiivirga citrea TaxID=1481457 RepID=A0A6M0CJT0_9FLAO|nr:type III pantothenate kinase [Spongiivirga citrea]NER18205.1 type III pantothenate kinase [Spongiivirga citrea]
MNLIVDAGNTRPKLAVFDKDRILIKEHASYDSLKNEIETILSAHPTIGQGIVSSVTQLEDSLIDWLNAKIPISVLTHESKLNFTNLYDTPSTLGVDRIALISAAAKYFQYQNVLVIDAGTCVTYDFKDNQNQYIGGAISPGLQIRYKSLNDYTANLPKLAPEKLNSFIGTSTETSIHSGVMNGLVQEIDGVINQYSQRYKHLTVILTGGDAKIFAEYLKNSIFADSNFLLKGLNTILECNKNQ